MRRFYKYCGSDSTLDIKMVSTYYNNVTLVCMSIKWQMQFLVYSNVLESYMYIGMYLHMYIHIYTCIHTYTSIYTYINAGMHINIHTGITSMHLFFNFV